jgi:DNA-binding GntR family transcriptional regulator
MSAEEDLPATGFERTLDTKKGVFRSALISDQVYALIRRAIVDHELAPGDRVVESDIARRLGVSQAPVREAVKRLAHEGLLTHIPRRGNFVTKVSKQEADQARQVRVPLERLAGRLAAERIDAAGIAELEAIVDKMRATVASADVDAFRDLDIKFHHTVAEIADNPFLTRVWEVLEPSLRALHAIADPLYEGDWMTMANRHGDLLELLRAGDARKAEIEFGIHAAGRSDKTEARRARRAKQVK